MNYASAPARIGKTTGALNSLPMARPTPPAVPGTPGATPTNPLAQLKPLAPVRKRGL